MSILDGVSLSLDSGSVNATLTVFDSEDQFLNQTLIETQTGSFLPYTYSDFVFNGVSLPIGDSSRTFSVWFNPSLTYSAWDSQNSEQIVSNAPIEGYDWWADGGGPILSYGQNGWDTPSIGGGHWGTNASINLWVYDSSNGAANVNLNFVLDASANISFSLNTADAEAFLSGDGWHHVVGTYDNTDNYLRLYLDGQFLGESLSYTVPLNTVSTDLSIGFDYSLSPTGNGDYYGQANPFTGLVDEVAVFDKALTNSEIQSLYAYGDPSHVDYQAIGGGAVFYEGFGPPAPELVGIIGINNLIAETPAAFVLGTDYVSLVDAGFESYGFVGLDSNWNARYGVSDGTSAGTHELDPGIDNFVVGDQTGFIFEGRSSASEELVLVGTKGVDANFNESKNDMDLLAFTTSFDTDPTDTSAGPVNSGIEVHMRNDGYYEVKGFHGIDDANGSHVTGGSLGVIANVEAIVGTGQADFIHGDSYQNVLMGGAGSDILIGGESGTSIFDETASNWTTPTAEWDVASETLTISISGWGQATNEGVTFNSFEVYNPATEQDETVSEFLPIYDIAWLDVGVGIADWALAGFEVSGDGTAELKVIDLKGNAAQALTGGSVTVLDLGLELDSAPQTAGTEWVVGGTGEDILKAGAMDSVLVDLDQALMIGGVGKDTFVVNGVGRDGVDANALDSSKLAAITDFQLSSDRTSLGGNLHMARDVVTFNVSSSWLMAVTGLSGAEIEAFNAYNQLTDASQSNWLTPEQVEAQRQILESVYIEFVPQGTDSNATEIHLYGLADFGGVDVKTIGAAATMGDWIVAEGAKMDSTFGAIWVRDMGLPTPVDDTNASVLQWMRANDATAIDLEVMDQVLQAVGDPLYGGVIDATEWDTIVLDAWEDVTGLTNGAGLSHTVNLLKDGFGAAVTALETQRQADTATYGETPIVDLKVNEVVRDVIEAVDTSHLFEDTINLSFAIEATRPNTVRGNQSSTPGVEGVLRSVVDPTTHEQLDSIFTPGRADERILSGSGADRFEYVDQDFDGEQADPTQETAGSFGRDVIVDFAASVASNEQDTHRDLLLIEGVTVDQVELPVVDLTQEPPIQEPPIQEPPIQEPPIQAGPMLQATRVTLGDNMAETSLEVSWTGDADTPGGQVLLYRQYDPTTDRYRVEDVQLGEQTYSLGETSAIRDNDGNIVGSIYSTDADHSILVGSSQVDENGQGTERFAVGNNALGGTGESSSSAVNQVYISGFNAGDKVDLSAIAGATVTSVPHESGTVLHVTNGTDVLDIFISATGVTDDDYILPIAA